MFYLVNQQYKFKTLQSLILEGYYVVWRQRPETTLICGGFLFGCAARAKIN